MKTAKLLVNAPNGVQQLVDVLEGGGYFDASRVLWDERVDGPMPAITLGSMVRQGNALVVDAATAATCAAAQKAIDDQAKRDDIDAQLVALDAKTIRALREQIVAPGVAGSDGKTPAQRLADYNTQAATLRAQRPA